MKLFIITHSYHGTGASQMLMSAASHWTHRLGWQVDAVAIPDMPPEALEALSLSNVRLIERAQFGEKYDVALINCLKNIHFVDLIYPHVPIVLWAHEAETILKSKVPQEQWQRWFAKVALVIFQTEWQRELFRKYLPGGCRVAVIPNGIPPIDLAANPAKAKDGTFRVATLGKLTPMKAQSDLIRVIPRLAEAHPVHCQLIGDTEHLPHLGGKAKKILKDHPSLFTLSGHLPRDQALEAVAAADLFCFPSLAESFGLAPLEAASLGVPVVLADLGVYRSIGWVSGENCRTFPPGDRRKLLATIEAVMKDASLRQGLAEKGKLLAARYDMAPFLTKISELIADADLEVV